MSPTSYTKDTLVQQTATDYLRNELGWESIYAHDKEDFGLASLLGRKSDREEVLNPGLPEATYDDTVWWITGTAASQTIVLPPTARNTT